MRNYNLKIFTDNIEPEALNQVYTLVKQPAFEGCKVRIMPDVHAGKGCVIGFTADLGDKVVPNLVGVDISCGMLTVKLNDKNINLEKLDQVIREYIPAGRNVNKDKFFDGSMLDNLYCYEHLKNISHITHSIGTLGGGNHFIEIDKDDDGMYYLIIHSGSRNLGKQVAEYYQNLAVEIMQGKEELAEKQNQIIREYKANGKAKDIQKALETLKKEYQSRTLGIPKDLCYLTDKYREMYLNDMMVCQEFADANRQEIADTIISKMGFTKVSQFTTLHNYIDIKENIIRKGAVSAKTGEILLIPINMRDGCIIARGKGNPDWNCSSPHGAGRIMSRSAAKENLSIDEYYHSMEGIFTTSVGMSTIDESPMAYKPMDEIIRNITDTVDVIKVIHPVYNFKAGD